MLSKTKFRTDRAKRAAEVSSTIDRAALDPLSAGDWVVATGRSAQENHNRIRDAKCGDALSTTIVLQLSLIRFLSCFREIRNHTTRDSDTGMDDAAAISSALARQDPKGQLDHTASLQSGSLDRFTQNLFPSIKANSQDREEAVASLFDEVVNSPLTPLTAQAMRAVSVKIPSEIGENLAQLKATLSSTRFPIPADTTGLATTRRIVSETLSLFLKTPEQQLLTKTTMADGADFAYKEIHRIRNRINVIGELLFNDTSTSDKETRELLATMMIAKSLILTSGDALLRSVMGEKRTMNLIWSAGQEGANKNPFTTHGLNKEALTEFSALAGQTIAMASAGLSAMEKLDDLLAKLIPNIESRRLLQGILTSPLMAFGHVQDQLYSIRVRSVDAGLCGNLEELKRGVLDTAAFAYDTQHEADTVFVQHAVSRRLLDDFPILSTVGERLSKFAPFTTICLGYEDRFPAGFSLRKNEEHPLTLFRRALNDLRADFSKTTSLDHEGLDFINRVEAGLPRLEEIFRHLGYLTIPDRDGARLSAMEQQCGQIYYVPADDNFRVYFKPEEGALTKPPLSLAIELIDSSTVDFLSIKHGSLEAGSASLAVLEGRAIPTGIILKTPFDPNRWRTMSGRSHQEINPNLTTELSGLGPKLAEFKTSEQNPFHTLRTIT